MTDLPSRGIEEIQDPVEHDRVYADSAARGSGKVEGVVGPAVDRGEQAERQPAVR
ncbi:hypothetical protein [Luedemannella flava]|uniref:hypothetical protein n=1 Tax=Luedemannella flava TaxID=349316 RepID=UPI0031D5C8A1